jgi:xylulokinase
LGVALQALWALEGGSITEIASEHVLFDGDKMHRPDRTAVELYAEAYKRYSMYVEALTPVFTRRT